MPTAAADYLHVCADRHRELTEKLTGKPQDLDAIERAVAGVRSKGTLTYDTVRAIVESPNFAAGFKFWSWPSRAEIEAGLHGHAIDLWHLPKNERAIIKQLRSVFRTFDAVSVILRFVVPKEYGILSTPVEHVLGIPPAAESIDRYLHYVSDLRTIRDKRGLGTAARVDQALWTLQLGVYGGRLQDVDALMKAHKADAFLRSIRVRNLADALFGPMSRLDLVEALIPHRPELAAQLAALEFERAVRAYAKKPAATEDLSSIIQTYAPHHAVGQWQRARALRNRAVHGKPLDQREVEALVLAARQIADLEQLKRG